MEFVRDFRKISKNDISLAGGKGASLGEMTLAGFSVPPGFVVLASAFDRFLEDNSLTQKIANILEQVDPKEFATIEQASQKIQTLILSGKLPLTVSQEIEKSFLKLDARLVAVRSSATAEDSKNAAWAGQLESYLNTTKKDLLENVQKCWASLFTPRAIFYRFEKNLQHEHISVAVVIQKMIQSEVSGVAFSVHPLNRDTNQMLIEACFGLGDQLVSGQVTPDSYVLEKKPQRILTKTIVKKQKLSDEQITKLANIIENIEKHYGYPSDIEWTFESNTFSIVQSRPITTLKS